MENKIKIALAILLLLCLLPMPYGYYQFVRIIGMIGFGILALLSKQDKKETAMIVFVVLAVLFQPFIKITLGRMLWNIVDVIVGVGLLVSTLKSNTQKP